MLHLVVATVLGGIYRYFFPEWIRTVARVVEPSSILGSVDSKSPYMCGCTLMYTVDGVVYRTDRSLNYHRELVEGDEIPIWYVRRDPTRIYVDLK